MKKYKKCQSICAFIVCMPLLTDNNYPEDIQKMYRLHDILIYFRFQIKINIKMNVTFPVKLIHTRTRLNQRNEKSDIVLQVSHATREFFIKLVPFLYVLCTRRVNPYQDAPDNRSLLIKVKCCLKASFRMTTLYCGSSAAEITFIHRFGKIILETFLFDFLFPCLY